MDNEKNKFNIPSRQERDKLFYEMFKDFYSDEERKDFIEINNLDLHE